jgi:Fe-S cluster assembly iron-binding protein IscA
MNKTLLALSAIATLWMTSCTETFKHKMEVADKYLDEIGATSVTCGTAAETSNGESMSMTTLSFSGCPDDIEDIAREWAANRVAVGFFGEMTEKDLEGETHLRVNVETDDAHAYEYTFKLNDLKKTEEFLKIADDALQVCINNDQEGFDKMKDDEMMPDDQMYQIYDVMAYNDSIYDGQVLATELAGFRFANGAEDPDLELFSVDYDVIGETSTTAYTINVDRKTKKVVYVWLKTTPN